MEFSLAVYPVASNLRSQLNIWYLDDGVVGDPGTVLRDLHTLINAENDFCVQLNLEKCEMFICGGSIEQQTSLKQPVEKIYSRLLWPASEAVTLLGAPLLNEAVPLVLDEKRRQLSD